MAFKQISYFNNVAINSLTSKKELNKNLYNKYYIRTDIETFKNNFIIDTFSDFEICNTKFDTPNSQGTSGLLNSFLFRNKLNSNLRFRLNSLKAVDSINVKFLESFNFIIKGLSTAKRKFRSLLLLSPVKGGFLCYCSGLSGFLPKSQANFLLSKIILKFRKTLKIKKSLELLNCFIKKSFKTRMFLFRFPLFFGKISIHPESKSKNFSNNKRLIKKYNNDLNIVFFSKIKTPTKKC